MTLVATAMISADDIVGEVVYVEGYPDIIRDGDRLYETLDFGFAVHNFDAIETDADSLAEINVDAETGIDATVVIRPKTQFTLRVSSLRSEQEGILDLLSGSVGVVVRELTGTSRLALRTHSSVAGVRGTIFDVTTGADGSVLVTAEEGTVEVAHGSGPLLFAARGEAVEINPEQLLARNIKYDLATAEFTRQWVLDRLETLERNPARFVRFYGLRYLAARADFDRTYRELMAHREIIDKWIEESRRGVTGSEDETSAEKTAIGATLAEATGALFEFENVRLRLEQMRPNVEAVLSSVELADIGTAGRMYAVIERDAVMVRRRIATVRFVQKLFALRNKGELPDEQSGAE